MPDLQHGKEPPPWAWEPLLRVQVLPSSGSLSRHPPSPEAHSPLLPRAPPAISPVCLGASFHVPLRKKKNAAHYLAHAIIYRCTPHHFSQFSSVQPLSRVQLFVTPWTAACQASLFITNSWSFIFCCPIFLPFHTVHGVLKARTLNWFAIPFSSGPHSVITQSLRGNEALR